MRRIVWVDNYKGLLLLFVVLSHFHLGGFVVDVAEQFFMPAFFFISGYLYNKRADISYTNYIYRKFSTLLWPYCCFALLSLPFCERIIIPNLQLIDIYTYMYEEFWTIVGGWGSSMTGPIWFLYTLFQTAVVGYGVIRYCSRSVCMIVAIVSFLIGWFLGINHVELPLHINIVFSSLFFYLIGWITCGSIEKINRRKESLIAITISVSVLFGCYIYDQTEFIMVGNIMGNNMLCFLGETLSGSLLLLFIFTQIEREGFNCMDKMFGFIAKNSITILAVHWCLLKMLWAYYPEWDDTRMIHILSSLVVCAITYIVILIVNRYMPWMLDFNKIR